MSVETIAAEITAVLGEPSAQFRDREVGLAFVSGWVWSARGAGPSGLRVERSGERYVVRAYQHTIPGRRAELIRFGAPTDDEIRSVVVLAGLLEDGGRP